MSSFLSYEYKPKPIKKGLQSLGSLQTLGFSVVGNEGFDPPRPPHACKVLYLGVLSTVNTGIRILHGVSAPTETEINLLYFIHKKAPSEEEALFKIVSTVLMQRY